MTKENTLMQLLNIMKHLHSIKTNLQALSEKAMTLDASKQYDEAIEVSKLAISTHPADDLKTVYLSYANSLDHQKKADLALKIYDEGLKKYPDY